jgi:RNA polymerase sigma-70 factor, ECF subfamily
VTDANRLLEALRSGDEEAFAALVEAHSPALLRVAMTHVGSRAVAEEVVQDTWLAVLRGLDGFEGRASLQTWVFRILTNTAKTRGTRERRTVPFSSLAPEEAEVATAGPPDWTTPEERALAAETRRLILSAIEALSPAQRTVITLRDVQGWPSEEVRQALEVSEGNQRVLLHRARSRVRIALEA